MSRVRLKYVGGKEGTLRYSDGTGQIFTTHSTSQYDRIRDDPPGSFNLLEIDKYSFGDPYLNGKGYYRWTFQDFCPNAFGGVTYIQDHCAAPGSPGNGEAATELLMKTNPSRPVVSLPNFIWELREIPQLLRKEGDDAISKAASYNLKYNFGIAPLVSDLGKLLSFSDSVSQREKELEALFTSGLRRKRQLFQGTGTYYDDWDTVHSEGVQLHYSIDKTTKETVWGYVEWKPNILPPKTADEMRALARQAVLGLTLDFSVAWEMIPWSWLIDWCSNVGDFLIARRNIIDCSPHNVTIMRKQETEILCKPDPNDKEIVPFMKDVKQSHVTKSRYPSSPSLSADLPYLSMKQMSILGSIGVLRRVPRR